VLASPGASAPFAPGQPLADEPDAAWSTPVDLTPVITNEVQVLGSRDGLLPEAVGLLERQEIDTAGLVTARFGLEDGVAALEAAGDARQIKVVMRV
jgi:threonine dehydrogenase-like Zn-dependent dehydrogenase